MHYAVSSSLLYLLHTYTNMFIYLKECCFFFSFFENISTTSYSFKSQIHVTEQIEAAMENIMFYYCILILHSIIFKVFGECGWCLLPLQTFLVNFHSLLLLFKHMLYFHHHIIYVYIKCGSVFCISNKLY